MSLLEEPSNPALCKRICLHSQVAETQKTLGISARANFFFYFCVAASTENSSQWPNHRKTGNMVPMFSRQGKHREFVVGREIF